RADGPDVERIRPLGTGGWTIGRSTHTPKEIEAGQTADYLFFGTVFTSRSKGPAFPPQGLDALRDAVRGSQVPVIAIGGIDVTRAAACAHAGAAGVAAIGLFLPAGTAPGALGPLM